MYYEEMPNGGIIRPSKERVCKTWEAEAALRMLQNNLSPEIAVNPRELIVYGGAGRAARNLGGG